MGTPRASPRRWRNRRAIPRAPVRPPQGLRAPARSERTGDGDGVEDSLLLGRRGTAVREPPVEGATVVGPSLEGAVTTATWTLVLATRSWIRTWSAPSTGPALRNGDGRCHPAATEQEPHRHFCRTAGCRCGESGHAPVGRSRSCFFGRPRPTPFPSDRKWPDSTARESALERTIGTALECGRHRLRAPLAAAAGLLVRRQLLG